MVPVFITTCAKYSWLIRPQAYLLNMYWSTMQPFTVVGFEFPDFELPANFTFCSLYPESCPAEEWSNALIHFLSMRDEYLFVLLLDDYWPIRKVDNVGIETLAEYMRIHDDVLRMDLTDDRLYAGGRFDVDSWGHYDIIETPFETPYQMSLQAGIWNRKLMLNVLVPGKSPWETELHTQPPEGMRVLGTRQMPMRYANIYKNGEIIQEQLDRVPQEHREAIVQWFPK